MLRREITELEESIQRTGDAREEVRLAAEEKRRKLAGALCGIVEVYMTDLSYVSSLFARFFHRFLPLLKKTIIPSAYLASNYSNQPNPPCTDTTPPPNLTAPST